MAKDKFINAKVIIEPRKGGKQPAIFIIEDGKVHMVTVTPDHNLYITDEGKVGERYDENGKWCGIDNKGRKRASFFYKAAFYDRDAFINFNTRYQTIVTRVADESSDYEVWKNSDYQGIVKDGEIVIFSTECIPPVGDYDSDNKIKDALRVKLDAYMKENYPDYENINAYWD